jgi:hypothetical protein
MFILRSAFWLAIGFALVAPHGTNLSAAAGNIGQQAVAAGVQIGQQLIVSQLTGSLTSAPQAKPSIDQSSAPSVGLPMQDSPTPPFVFPRPRPAAMG